ncbi:hypothetical protein G6F46_015537 [Rhizopus delemar]|nr:hypothetical protein G6F46_015537 [Rhizopus delemar]
MPPSNNSPLASRAQTICQLRERVARRDQSPSLVDAGRPTGPARAGYRNRRRAPLASHDGASRPRLGQRGAAARKSHWRASHGITRLAPPACRCLPL